MKIRRLYDVLGFLCLIPALDFFIPKEYPSIAIVFNLLRVVMAFNFFRLSEKKRKDFSPGEPLKIKKVRKVLMMVLILSITVIMLYPYV